MDCCIGHGSSATHVEVEEVAGERRGRGEEREQAGGWPRYPGGTPAELEAKRGGGRCGGRGKGGRESAPVDEVSGQCGKRTAGGAVGMRRADEGPVAAQGTSGFARIRERRGYVA